MSIATLATRFTGFALVGLAVLGVYRALDRDDAPRPAEAHPSVLYGVVTETDGTTHEGRLRFGGDQEAFWGDYFNGFRDENVWADYVPSSRLKGVRDRIEIFGVSIWRPAKSPDLRRPFMARFGDIARLEADGGDLTVTLKNGSVVHLDRYAADDFADGVRIWDADGGVVDLGERKVRSIDFLAPAHATPADPQRLYGTVHTLQGDFTGFLQWDRRAAVAADPLGGRNANGEEVRLAFGDLRSLTRRSHDSVVATRLDGEELVLSDRRGVGNGHRGIYVDDPRYGRVLVSWDAFDRVDFHPAEGRASGSPAYDDFPAVGPLTGVVTTRSGQRLAGRLVYDLDESEFIETLDAPVAGVDYTIPFGLVASVVLDGSGTAPGRAHVLLHGGEELELERDGDLGDGNAGLLVFGHGTDTPEYVAWSDVARVDFDRPRAMYPALAGR